MGAILGILALAAVCIVCIAVVRAKREHESMITVLHAEIDSLHDDFDTLYARLESVAKQQK